MSKDKQSKKTTEPTSESDDLAAIQQKLQEVTDALQRERADSVNIRRRHEDQITGLQTAVKAQVVKDLLPVIDNFERAMAHLPQDVNASDDPQVKQLNEWVAGVQKILQQLHKTLTAIGVRRIATVGEPFDPAVHEAVTMEEGDGAQEMVCEELQSGYAIGDEVVRHAMVRVRMQ
ncbi:nucleotide exchange factor GrpE [Candidatus Saccharibacteria bacterium]|nr:MAG: nucleotide exchange factor GrpE [Candidatus Saccharibacteria bacterium]